MATQILAPTTAAAQSTPFVVLTERWVTVEQIGLAAAETAALQQTPDNGATWVNVLSAGVAVALTATLRALKVDSVGIWKSVV